VLGYVTAANVFTATDVVLVDVDAIFAWLDNYCREHPLELLIKASD
jgi:hypothetical protein